MNRKHISTNLATAKRKRSSLLQKHRFCTVALVIMTSVVMLFGCRHHNDSKKLLPITITVQGDAHVTVNEPKSLPVEKGVKWSAIKDKVKVSYAEGFEPSGWKIGTASGADIKDDTGFNEDTIVFAVSKQKTPPTPDQPPLSKITITVQGDAHVTVNEPKTLSVEKGVKWSAIKDKVKVSYAEGFKPSGWKIGTVSGADIKDDTVFNEDTTVFAVSKNINERTYRVRHLQQNVSGNEYTPAKEESQAGMKGEPTTAVAETYQGFTALAFSQVPIADDNSTVVEIKYNRNIITLEFNLDHGSTTTSLEEGKFLKGRFGAPVSIADPTKADYKFDKWEPELPKKFPSQSPSTVYTAKWKQLRITIQGDERIAATALGTTLPVAYNATWADIEAAATEKAVLKTEWGTDDYEIYQWRLTDANGKRLETTHVFTDDATVYAVTNYKKDKFKKGLDIKTLDGYEGDKPKGAIIIPEEYTAIGPDAFKECSDITNVTLPNTLEKIGEHAFYACTKLTAMNIPAAVTDINTQAFFECSNLGTLTVDPKNNTYASQDNILYTKDKTKLLCAAFTLEHVTTIPSSVEEIGHVAFLGRQKLLSITLPNNLKVINRSAFLSCSNLKELIIPDSVTTLIGEAFVDCTSAVITLGKNITKIEPWAFGYGAPSFCKEVRIPNGVTFDHIVTKVKNAGYPEERIKRY